MHTANRTIRNGVLSALALASLVGLTGCTREGKFQAISMWNESRLKPLEPSPMAGMESSSLAPPPGTIARGEARPDDPAITGRSAGKLLASYPFPVTEAVLARGQERFNIYCSPCHGPVGNGQGTIVRRGFPHPPDYALRRLRQAPVGHFFDVMTNGYGVMYSYASRVPPNDRWAIAAYIRVLQDRRPELITDPYEAERLRARRTGIGTRPVTPGGGEPAHPAEPGPGTSNPGQPPTSPGMEAPAGMAPRESPEEREREREREMPRGMTPGMAPPGVPATPGGGSAPTPPAGR